MPTAMIVSRTRMIIENSVFTPKSVAVLTAPK